MASFVIQGGTPLSGSVEASGNKNAALPALACALLSDAPTTIRNFPRIGDVNTMLRLLESMEIRFGWKGDHEVTVDASRIRNRPLDTTLCRKVRGSILLLAPLLHRFGEAVLPLPGGDRIGRRRIDTHLLALERMGAVVEEGELLTIRAPRGLRGADILLDEASVTATENTVMAAALAAGETVIRNAACEPHVQDLCRLLNDMGARVRGIGCNEIHVEGVGELGGGAIALGSDYLEVASFLVLAAVTGGDLTVRNASPGHLRMILHQFRRLGIEAEVTGEDVRVAPGQPLAVRADFGGAIPSLYDAPWPAFPADLTSVALVAGTQAAGSVLIHEKMFESRLFFVDQLIDMGARIVLCDPHRAVVIGPSRLRGARMSSPDIRAGMALLIASLCAEGESVIGNIGQIDRGYERIDRRLRALGAAIERVEQD